MKSLKSRFSAAALLAVIAFLVAAASAPPGPAKEPDKLIILSTTDVKGKTGPCG
jgi:hypothetical protein